jgi:hypothetical protein
MWLARAVLSGQTATRLYSASMAKELWFKIWVIVLEIAPIILTFLALFWR